MAHPHKPLNSLTFTTLIFTLILIHPHTNNALSFNFPSFEFNQTDLTLEWDASFDGPSIHLTKNPSNGPIHHSAGRAMYHKAMQLWEVNGSTRKLADFTTCFSFNIANVTGYPYTGDGIAFFLVPENAIGLLPDKYSGGLLGLFASQESAVNDTVRNRVVAVEFDTTQNVWDNSPAHIGIDVNSIKSVDSVNVTGGFMNKGTLTAWVNYSSAATNLAVSLTFSASMESYNFSHNVDLMAILPQRVRIGFSAATGSNAETHDLYSWSFSSSIEEPPGSAPSPPPAGKHKKKVGLVVGTAIGALFVVILAIGVAVFCVRWSRRKPLFKDPQHGGPAQTLWKDQLGPKRFSYNELSEATDGFAEELKLGKGGFGDVYEGKLASSNEKVAIKMFRSARSNQGEKEYVSEVSIISKLMHKNLVQLRGWCHDNGELLLVYDFMLNRSLDFHLFGKHLPPLTWPTRYKIIIDLASALHYLQDMCDPFVLHRDIKSSNIMLDSNFNAKLGDFGLARLTNQGQSFKTTVPAGTLGYLAPEVLSRQKVSKASDIYSFGVVALEIASGRRPVIQSREDPSNEMNLVEWVWKLYGKGSSILDAVDNRLEGEFNHDQARRMMMVGLWCCHPDPEYRPSIRQVQAVLNFEAMEPSLPPSIPKPTYVSSNTSMDMTEAGSSTRASHTTSGNTIST